MTPYRELVKQLSRDEGRVPHAYPDSKGYMTIGVGHLIDVRKGGRISETVIDILLEDDIAEKTLHVRQAIPWSNKLDEARFGVLINMAFNLGIKGLLGFKRMLKAMEAGNWAEAAYELADPNYVKDVGDRAHRLAKQVLTGEWQ